MNPVTTEQGLESLVSLKFVVVWESVKVGTKKMKMKATFLNGNISSLYVISKLVDLQ